MMNSSNQKHPASKVLLVLLALALLSACSVQANDAGLTQLSVGTLASSPTPAPGAVTEIFDATAEELAQLVQQEASQAPFLYEESSGSYNFLCLLESISYLNEASFIHVEDYAITVIGNCSFLDVLGNKQTVPVGLVIQNTIRATTWMPHHRHINARLIGEKIQVFFTQTAGGIRPGSVISVAFGVPNAENRELAGGAHNAFVATEMYKNGSDIVFAQTGDPAVLNGILVPLNIGNSPISRMNP